MKMERKWMKIRGKWMKMARNWNKIEKKKETKSSKTRSGKQKNRKDNGKKVIETQRCSFPKLCHLRSRKPPSIHCGFSLRTRWKVKGPHPISPKILASPSLGKKWKIQKNQLKKVLQYLQQISKNQKEKHPNLITTCFFSRKVSTIKNQYFCLSLIIFVDFLKSFRFLICFPSAVSSTLCIFGSASATFFSRCGA